VTPPLLVVVGALAALLVGAMVLVAVLGGPRAGSVVGPDVAAAVVALVALAVLAVALGACAPPNRPVEINAPFTRDFPGSVREVVGGGSAS
jgi:hypothetical protein